MQGSVLTAVLCCTSSPCQELQLASLQIVSALAAIPMTWSAFAEVSLCILASLLHHREKVFCLPGLSQYCLFLCCLWPLSARIKTLHVHCMLRTCCYQRFTSAKSMHTSIYVRLQLSLLFLCPCPGIQSANLKCPRGVSVAVL